MGRRCSSCAGRKTPVYRSGTKHAESPCFMRFAMSAELPGAAPLDGVIPGSCMGARAEYWINIQLATIPHQCAPTKTRQIPSCGTAPKTGARPRQAWRWLGPAVPSKKVYQARGRGGVSTARRALRWCLGMDGRAGGGGKAAGRATAGPWRGHTAQARGRVRAGACGAVRAQKRPPHGWPLSFGMGVRRRGPVVRWPRWPGGWPLCRSSAGPVLSR